MSGCRILSEGLLHRGSFDAVKNPKFVFFELERDNTLLRYQIYMVLDEG